MDNTTTTRPTWRAWVGLAVLSVPLFMMATDMTVLFLATPSIAADLEPSSTQLLWIMHSGEFVAAGLVITMGRLADKIGRLRLLMIAMALYGLSSALAAFSTSPEMLLLCRMLIGASAAAASPAAIGLLRSMFTTARQYGIAFAVLMGAFTVGGALGPPMGGLLLEHFWWGSVFLVNVPAAALVLLAGKWLLPSGSGSETGRIDATSVGLSLGAVILVVFGLQEIADQGWSVLYAVSIVVGIALGWLFIRRQRRVDDPLLDLGLFGYRALRLSVLVLIIASLAFMATDLVLVQYLQIVTEVPLATLGLLLAIPGAASVLATILIPFVNARFAPSHVMAVGLTIGVGGTAVVVAAIFFASDPLPWLIIGSSLITFGISPVMVLGSQLIVTSAPPERAGSAVAIQDVGAGLGGAVGMAMFGSLALAVFSRALWNNAPGDIDPSQVEAASQSPGGAVAVSQLVGGEAGAELREATNTAWSLGTQAVFSVAVLMGIALIVMVLRGLRGIRLPSDDEDSSQAPNGGPDSPQGPSEAAIPHQSEEGDLQVRSGRHHVEAPVSPVAAVDSEYRPSECVASGRGADY